MSDCTTFAKIRMEPPDETANAPRLQRPKYTSFRVTYYWRPRLQKMARQLLMIMNRQRHGRGTSRDVMLRLVLGCFSATMYGFSDAGALCVLLLQLDKQLVNAGRGCLLTLSCAFCPTPDLT